MRTAVVVGATGLTGKGIVNHLLQSEHYERVITLSRKPLNTIKHKKLTSFIVDFDNIFKEKDDWQQHLQGDDLFSALGTTLKQAGSKEAQYAVDYQLQADIAKIAKTNGLKRFFLVSSAMANSKSRFFYTRTKGEMEDYAKSLNFEALVIFHPSIIHGSRPDKRAAEQIGANIFNGLSKIVPNSDRFKPITGDDLGLAVVRYAEGLAIEGVSKKSVVYVNNEEIHRQLI